MSLFTCHLKKEILYLHQIEENAKTKVPIDLGNSVDRTITISCDTKCLTNSHIHHIRIAIDTIDNHKEG